MLKKHVNIPIFIPELACPHQCIFCNQKKISGKQTLPSLQEIHTTIQKHLNTINLEQTIVEIAFFGGNFTGLDLKQQEIILSSVQTYLKHDQIQSIRISTRPDYINQNNLDLLQHYHVKTIEVGAQSFDNDVLKTSGRGHTSEDIYSSSDLVKKNNFKLGLQMMIGLPQDTFEKAFFTANQIHLLKADFTRIYPLIVIRETQLENLYMKKKFIPLSLEEAVQQSKSLLLFFEKSEIPVIRLGLHPSETLINKTDFIAGPFHPSFRELVLTEIWGDLFSYLLTDQDKIQKIQIFVSPHEYNYAIGYKSKNKFLLKQKFKAVSFYKDESMIGRNFKIKVLN